MLLRYNVSNFKSIGRNIEFSMLPLPNTSEQFLTTINTKVGEWKVLRRGVLFGPNASGKTSFIDSISFAKRYILKGADSKKITRVNQFKGEIEECGGLTTFQFLFFTKGEVFEYGFTLDKYQVNEEWLSRLSKEGKMEDLFYRITNNDKVTSVDITSKYARNKSKERELAELLKTGIRENQANQLFLKKLSENGSKIAETVMDWFESIQIIYPNTKLKSLPVQIKTNDELRMYLSDQLEKLDTGVVDISIATEEIEFEKFNDMYELPSELIQEIEETANGIITINGQCYIFSDSKKGQVIFVKVNFTHKLNGKDIPLNLEEESDGTRRVIDLLPILFRIDDKRTSKIFFVDELDRSLHTKLSKEFVKKFEEVTENVFAQLVFTAHDVNLLDLTLFRTEEIWFIEKKKSGETSFRPFSDFEIKDEQNILKDYLNGRFGAVPVIKKV